ncbi:YggS family pyridoxal phosphate-dependent enzyme [Desulfobulbus sp. F4]|nr:YggS family pyridoxal phosphate-dependent enzyme [Desulfobulbus sp. F4]
MIGDNLAHIRAAVREAALRCGRTPDAVKIVAVSKHVTAARLTEAQVHGQTVFGENYLQEAAGKISQLDPALEWHFIGHLQSNKAATAAELFQVIQTVDRLKIAAALNQHAGRLGKTLDVLVQINVGREAQKSGVLPEDAASLLRELRPLANLRVRGLMTMPPLGCEPEASRPWFRSLKQLSLQLVEEGLFHDNAAVELSMGLSGDFCIAIEEWATIIRIGTAIFGERLQQQLILT